MKKLILVCLLFVSTNTYAAITVGTYLKTKNTPETLMYVAGLGHGLMAANAELRTRGQEQIYCQPGKLAITNEQYISYIDEELKDPERGWLYEENWPISIILSEHLKYVFHCN